MARINKNYKEEREDSLLAPITNTTHSFPSPRFINYIGDMLKEERSLMSTLEWETSDYYIEIRCAEKDKRR